MSWNTRLSLWGIAVAIRAWRWGLRGSAQLIEIVAWLYGQAIQREEARGRCGGA